MKALLCLPLLFAACAWADESAERQDIDRVIASVNDNPPAATFTADSDARPTLERLRPWAKERGRRPAVVISHDPWGEATISWTGPCGPIVSRTIRFITPDVALADATCGYGDSSGLPLLFVLKKERADWKIASLRILAPR